MRAISSLCVSLAFTLSLACQGQQVTGSQENHARATSLMADILPHTSVAFPFLMIHGDDCHGMWGNLFGDNIAAALIGVEPLGNAHSKTPAPSELFLLLYDKHDKRWRVEQHLGQMEPMTETARASEDAPWLLKQRKGGLDVFLLGRMDLNNGEDRLSWRLDPRSHRLMPTGWPKDAVPSISENAITFRRFQPGRGPLVKTIFRYEERVGDELISISEQYDQQHIPTVTLSLPASKNGTATSWRIRAKGAGYQTTHDLYELCRTTPPEAEAAFVPHAVMTFEWDDEHGDLSAARFIAQRLAGVGRASYDGVWDGEDSRQLLLPKSVSVTGDTEAKNLFSFDRKD
jgi:hypothetical protein